MLSTNDLGPRAGNEIAAMLRKNRYITAIDLSENHMGPKVRHALQLPSSIASWGTRLCDLIAGTGDVRRWLNFYAPFSAFLRSFGWS